MNDPRNVSRSEFDEIMENFKNFDPEKARKEREEKQKLEDLRLDTLNEYFEPWEIKDHECGCGAIHGTSIFDRKSSQVVVISSASRRLMERVVLCVNALRGYTKEEIKALEKR